MCAQMNMWTSARTSLYKLYETRNFTGNNSHECVLVWTSARTRDLYKFTCVLARVINSSKWVISTTQLSCANVCICAIVRNTQIRGNNSRTCVLVWNTQLYIMWRVNLFKCNNCAHENPRKYACFCNFAHKVCTRNDVILHVFFKCNRVCVDFVLN